MIGRAFIASLLIVLLVMPPPLAIAQETIAQNVGDEATKITAVEAQEVLAVAERFVRRMQQTHDLAPLIGEMFVSDYAGRLHQQAVNDSLVLMDKSVAQQSSREEVMRFYLALNNCGYLYGLLLAAYEASHPKAEDDEDESDMDFEKVLPPDILELFKSDPLIKMWMEEEDNEEAQETQADDQVKKTNTNDEANKPDMTAEQLRHLTATMEQAIPLARKHLGASSSKLTYLERHKKANEEENWKAERDGMNLRAWVLTKEFYGYPEGTRIFCANALIYHMDLVRVDGKLKVLALYLDMD